MKPGICLLSLIPQRAEPSEKSEMVNQLLFGDVFTVTEKHKNWLKVTANYDGYEGWIDEKMVDDIDEHYFSLRRELDPFVVPHLIRIQNTKDNSYVLLSPGSYLCDNDEEKFKIDNVELKFEKPSEESKFKAIKDITEQFINVPYLWGGRSIFGIDCSGFVQVIYKILGIKLPRDASDQSKVGTPVEFIQETQAGDLAFFDNEEGAITHVGILLDNQTIIHASGQVRVDKIDAHGIFNSNLNDYSHKLRIIKRFDDKILNDKF